MPKKTREVDPFSLDDGDIFIHDPDTGSTAKYSKGQYVVVTAPECGAVRGSKRHRRGAEDGAEENAAILGDRHREQPQVRRCGHMSAVACENVGKALPHST
jgi:hypothetical protein